MGEGESDSPTRTLIEPISKANEAGSNVWSSMSPIQEGVAVQNRRLISREESMGKEAIAIRGMQWIYVSDDLREGSIHKPSLFNVR